jgi:hypothetical protein
MERNSLAKMAIVDLESFRTAPPMRGYFIKAEADSRGAIENPSSAPHIPGN